MAKRIVDEEMRFSIIVNGNEAQKELFDLEKSTRELTKTNKELRAEKKRLVAQGKKDSEEYRKLDQELRANNVTIKTNKARMQELQETIGVTGLTMAQLRKRASELKLQLFNMVPGSAEYKRLEADLKEVDAQIVKLRMNSRSAGSSISRLANGFNKYAALGASFIATATGMVLSIKK